MVDVITRMLGRYDEDLLLRYVEDELTPRERDKVHALLAADPRTAEVLTEMKRQRQALMAAGSEEPPQSLTTPAIDEAATAEYASASYGESDPAELWQPVAMTLGGEPAEAWAATSDDPTSHHEQHANGWKIGVWTLSTLSAAAAAALAAGVVWFASDQRTSMDPPNRVVAESPTPAATDTAKPTPAEQAPEADFKSESEPESESRADPQLAQAGPTDAVADPQPEPVAADEASPSQATVARGKDIESDSIAEAPDHSLPAEVVDQYALLTAPDDLLGDQRVFDSVVMGPRRRADPNGDNAEANSELPHARAAASGQIELQSDIGSYPRLRVAAADMAAADRALEDWAMEHAAVLQRQVDAEQAASGSRLFAMLIEARQLNQLMEAMETRIDARVSLIRPANPRLELPEEVEAMGDLQQRMRARELLMPYPVDERVAGPRRDASPDDVQSDEPVGMDGWGSILEQQLPLEPTVPTTGVVPQRPNQVLLIVELLPVADTE